MAEKQGFEKKITKKAIKSIDLVDKRYNLAAVKQQEMNSANRIFALIFLTLFSQGAVAQSPQSATSPDSVSVVVITGARFLYPLLEHWIDAYVKENPSVQLIIDSRGSNDPLHYDILAEVRTSDDALLRGRQVVNVGRYAVLPVTHRASPLAEAYGEKGLTVEQIKEIFFDDIFKGESKRPVLVAYTPYRRLQRAGVPEVFSRTFGYTQKDLKGNAIAGADAHIVKALLRDTEGVSFLPISLIYDVNSREINEGLALLPFDLDGNNRISDDERLRGDLDELIATIESAEPRSVKHLPVADIHLSVDKSRAHPEALAFLRWVSEQGHTALHAYGFLLPEGAVSSQGDPQDVEMDRRADRKRGR